MRLREIEVTDIKDILDIRVSTKENHFSMTDLAEVGVTPESIAEWLEGSVKGWLCEISGKPVGFALADSKTAEVLVVACYPEYEKRGIGKALMLKVHEWLWSYGHDEIWLWSDPDLPFAHMDSIARWVTHQRVLSRAAMKCSNLSGERVNKSFRQKKPT